MDKQKQIEEMEKDILHAGCYASEECLATECEDCRYESYFPERCKNKFRIEYFYNAGYRKIPEGAVVLTKEEYERLLKIEKDFNTVHYCFVEKSRAEEVRKETAEKFAEMASKAFIGLNCIDIDEWNWCQRKIDEICKEIIGEKNDK